MPRSKSIQTLQVLRAIAALAVVLHHFASEFSQTWGKTLGNGGVVLFFVLSGYIIPVSIHGNSPLVFLRRRAERVVPLYWIFTTLKLIANSLLPFTKSLGTLSYIVLSYLMLPVSDGTGAHQPLLVVGWTLVFEAMFYLMVAVAMILPKHRTLGLVAAIVLAIAVVGPNPGMAPLYSCFAAGIVLAMAQRSLTALPPMAGAALFLAGILGVFAFGPHLPAAIACAAACISGALAIEDTVTGRIPSFLTLLGDASYSLYLSHVLLLMPAKMVSRKLHLKTAEALAFYLAIALSTALVSYFWIERPLIALFRNRRSQTQDQRLVPAAGLAA